MGAALQMFITTGEAAYARRFEALLWASLDDGPQRWRPIGLALQAVPHFGDEYGTRLRPYVEAYREAIDEYAEENPNGVPISRGGSAGNNAVVHFAITNLCAHEHYPDLVRREDVLGGLQ